MSPTIVNSSLYQSVTDDNTLINQQSTDIGNLPNLLIGVILQHLPISNLSNYCQISKKVNAICSLDTVWKENWCQDYWDLWKTKPNDMTYLQWYHELKKENILNRPLRGFLSYRS